MHVPNATDVPSPPRKNTGASEPVRAQILPRANTEKLAVYFSGMHALLNAGVGLTIALDEMGRSAPNGDLRRASVEMKAQLAQGRPWSEAMRAYPGLFSEMMISLVAAGETSGNLAEICGSIGEFAEKEYQVRQLIKRETWYPKLVLFFSIAIVPLPITVAFAGFRHTFSGFEQAVVVLVPWALWALADFLWPLTSGSAQRQRIDRWKLNLPIVGPTARGFAVAKSCRLFGMLYAAGVSLPRAACMAADGCGNAAFAQSLRQTAPRMARGETLTSALTATDEFPDVALGLFRTGEQSGDLDKTLPRAARFLEMDAETRLYQAAKALTVLLMCLVGLKVGVQVVQFWLEYYGQFQR